MEAFKVFLSHSTKDKEFVEKLAAALRHEGIEPWLCEVDIIAADNFVAKIEEGLSSSDLTILVWSPEAAHSPWTGAEWTSVLDREISGSRRRLGDVVAWVKRMRDMRWTAGTGAAKQLLDYDPVDLVRRAEHLEGLYVALAEKPEAPPFLLYGEPGSGKSTLALKFAWRSQGAFDAVVFQLCGQRAARLKLDVGTLPPEKQLVPGPPVSVLCTSRQRHLPWVEPSHSREVQSFWQEEAETIFRRYLGEETTRLHREALLKFAERVERMPIAVVVAADLLRREFDPMDEASRGLQLERLRNDIHDVPDLLQRAIESQGERERQLIEAMAICAAEGFWLPLAARIADFDETAMRQSRDRLMNSSLLRLLDRDRQRFQLHGLLGEQLRKNPNMADLQAKHVAVLEKQFRDWESNWRECRECLPEVIPAMQFLWKSGERNRVGDLASKGFAGGWRIGELEAGLRILREEESFWAGRKDKTAKWALQQNFGNQGEILQAWGCLEEAISLHKKEEALCLELGLRRGLGYCYWNWGLLARAQSDREAEQEKLQGALEIFTELNMPEQRDAVRAELDNFVGSDRPPFE